MNLAPGSGVQLTPWGFSALGDASGVQGDGQYAPAAAPVVESGPDGDEYDGPPDIKAIDRAFRSIDAKAEEHSRRVAALKTKTGGIKPADVLRLARARVREIKTELKRHAALKKELTQLENMLSAAKHLAPVRDIKGARRAI